MELYIRFPSLLILIISLQCCYTECEALNYQGLTSDENASDKFADTQRLHVRFRRNSNGNESSCSNHENCTERINHKYYVSEVVGHGQRYWRDIKGHPNTTTHQGLSDQFLRTQQLCLSFKFPYYGHYLDRVLLTTGGFLYMDIHDTTLIKNVQYLAPLMAYFNPKLNAASKVLTLDDGKQLTVQWLNVLLHNKPEVGTFNFQCTLHRNGTIWFAYKQVPVPVDSIPEQRYHPVRVGISDAFVMLRRDPVSLVISRIFYVYSRVNISKKSVVNGSAVIFHPQPSCVLGDSCAGCMELDRATGFGCHWCNITKRCSDGADRHRAEWERNRCGSVSVKNIPPERCVDVSTKFPTTFPTASPERRKTSTAAVSGSVAAAKQQQLRNVISAGAIVGICLALVLVICVGAWCLYVYRNPTSKAGLCVINISPCPRWVFHRSYVSARQGTAVASSNVKHQVLESL